MGSDRPKTSPGGPRRERTAASANRFTSIIDFKFFTSEWFRAGIDTKSYYVMPPATANSFPAAPVPRFEKTTEYILSGLWNAVFYRSQATSLPTSPTKIVWVKGA